MSENEEDAKFLYEKIQEGYERAGGQFTRCSWDKNPTELAKEAHRYAAKEFRKKLKEEIVSHEI